MGTIEQLKSIIGKRQGLAKSNRFKIFMSPPESVTSSVSVNETRDIELMCESCSLPGRQITTLDYSLIRQQLKIPNGYLNQDITFVFHLTNDYFMKRLFDQWSSLIIDQNTYKLNYKNDYQRDITIYQIDENNNNVYGVVLKNAFPITVESIDLNNTSENTTQKVSVTFTYEDFEQERNSSLLSNAT